VKFHNLLNGLFASITCLCFLTFIPPPAFSQPVVDLITITDVTTKGFSVVWVSDVPSTASVRVFTDVGGADEITGGLLIEAHPLMCGDGAVRTAAEDAGVMKVGVAGDLTTLVQGQVYYVQTVTTEKGGGGGVTYEPDPGALLPVALQSRTVRTKEVTGSLHPLTNDLLLHFGYGCDGVTPALGALVVAGVTDSDYPITGFVGDCIEEPYALLDLNNVFGPDRRTLELEGTETILLTVVRGSAQGSLDFYRRVPVDDESCELEEALICDFADGLNADVNQDDIVNILDLLKVASTYGAALGDCQYNPDYNLNVTDDTINILDLLKVSTHYEETPPCP